MSDIHVLTGRHRTWQLVMHIAVPDQNNAIGISYRSALVESGLGGTTQLLDGDGTNGTISAAEKVLIEAGEVLECSADYVLESGGTSNAQLLATLDEFYTTRKPSILGNFQEQLRYYGFTRNVP